MRRSMGIDLLSNGGVKLGLFRAFQGDLRLFFLDHVFGVETLYLGSMTITSH